jgi:putative addiction module component (TIGR02574 family)
MPGDPMLSNDNPPDAQSDDIMPTDLDPAYESELIRRLDEMDSGHAQMLSLDEVMARLRS